MSPADRRPTMKAIRECAEAMKKCLDIGWQKDDLDKLEEIWWSVHDDNGKLPSERTAAVPPAGEGGRE